MLKLFMAGGLATAAGATSARAVGFEADETAMEPSSLALPAGSLMNFTAGLPSVNLNAASLPLLPQLDAPVMTVKIAAQALPAAAASPAQSSAEAMPDAAEAPRPLSGRRMIADIFGEPSLRQAADDRERLAKNGKKAMALAGKIASHWGGMGVAFSGAQRPAAPSPRVVRNQRHKAPPSSAEEALAAQAAR
ncbi:MAG: hypothetical protein KGI84_10010 [Elusimicrobia bacterium]|nr:hypothetical protein [Elusimicrobiota bacterium]